MNRPTERLEAADRSQRRADRADLPGQVVLVLQGGGALGSYQAGVYQGLQEAGIEPDWVIGTSIGAISKSDCRKRAAAPARAAACVLEPRAARRTLGL
jgi:NTE family protein